MHNDAAACNLKSNELETLLGHKLEIHLLLAFLLLRDLSELSGYSSILWRGGPMRDSIPSAASRNAQFVASNAHPELDRGSMGHLNTERCLHVQ